MHVWVGWDDPATSRPLDLSTAAPQASVVLESWVSAAKRSLDPRLDVPMANQTPRLGAMPAGVPRDSRTAAPFEATRQVAGVLHTEVQGAPSAEPG
jgi:hypothetical protein